MEIEQLDDQGLAEFIRASASSLKADESLLERVSNRALSLLSQSPNLWTLSLREIAKQGMWGERAVFYASATEKVRTFISTASSAHIKYILSQDLGAGIQYFLVAQYGKLDNTILTESLLQAPPLIPYIAANNNLSEETLSFLASWVDDKVIENENNFRQWGSSLIARVSNHNKTKTQEKIPLSKVEEGQSFHNIDKSSNWHLIWSQEGIETSYPAFFAWAMYLLKHPQSKMDNLLAVDILGKLFKLGYIKHPHL